jgi:PKD repeat protein
MWDPNDATGKKVWAGGVSGGLWFNNDITSASSTWTKVDDFWSNLAVNCIAYDPNNTQIFYVGTGESFGGISGQGIWKSTNGGTTWTQLSASANFGYVADIVVRNEAATSVVYAGIIASSTQGGFFGSEFQGLQRSTDGGATFTQVMKNLPNFSQPSAKYGVGDIEIGPDNRLWIGTYRNNYSDYNGLGGGTILFSDDGTSFTTAYETTVSERSGRVELAVSSSNALAVYGLIENDEKIKQIVRTSDGGATWSLLALPDDDDNGIDADDFTRGQAWYDLIAEVDPNRDSTVVIGGINLHMSTDGGGTWKQISKWSNNANMGSMPYSYVHADQHVIRYKPGSSSEIIFGNDGGVFWTNDFSNPSATDLIVGRNNGYNVTQFYANAIHPDKAKNYFLAGAQDNGTQQFQVAGINATVEVRGGDGAYCFIDQTDAVTQIASYVYNDYRFSTNNWATSSSIASDDATGHFINPADYDDEMNVLYTAATESTIGRFIKDATGFTRNDLSISLSAKASHLRVSQHTRQSTTLFVGTAAGRLFKISKANSSNSSSTEITGSGFPNGWISSIEVGQDESHLLVTFSNYGVNSVWYTADGGTTWTSKEGNLPNFPVRWAMFNPTNFDEVILATEMGIWGTKSVTAASPTWAQFNNGLANVRVDMLQMRDSDFEVIAATHGRGLYSSSIFAGQSALTANFVAKNRTTEKNTAVEFVDRSKGATSWAWTFEGGTPATSTSQNPSVTYASNGAYTVTLEAKNASGGSAIKTIAAYVQVGPEDDSVTPPLAPSLLTAQALPSEIKLSWVDNADNEASFFVERSTDGTAFEKIKNLPANTTSYTNGGLTQATRYFFRIAATNKNGDSDYSDVVEVTTTEFAIEAPTGLTVAAKSSVSVVLDWIDNSDDEESFEIQRSEDNDQFITLGTIGADTISFDDLSLMPSSTYFYKVKGVNATGESDYTEVVEIKTLDPLEAPTALRLDKATGRKVVLSWVDNSSRETSFIVERAVGTGAFAKLTELEADATEFTDNAVLELTDYKYRLYAVNDVLEVSSKTTSLLVSTPEKGFADLTITDLNVPASQSAKEITVGATVSNDSDDPTEGTFEVSFYLSEDETISSADELLGVVAFEEMEDGAEQTASGTFDMVILTAGEYFVIAVVDEESVIEEKDETNNKKSTSITLTEVLSVADDLRQNIKVYPNPTTAVINVTSEAGKIDPFNIRITDLSGKLLKIQTKVEGAVRIDMGDLPSGVYLLTIQKEGGQYSTRILKH